MGKKKKAQRNKRRKQQKRKVKSLGFTDSVSVWTDDAAVHARLSEERPPQGFFEVLAYYFQRELRDSPLWDKMVREFDKEEAEKLLKECRVKSAK